jgi:signal transduction histidine kinase
LLGTFLAKRHGKLTLLLLIGFLLPTITYSADWGILVYRFLVALAAPIWIVRSATGKMQKRAGVISIAVLLVFQFIIGESYSNVTVIIDQLILAAGLSLAIALYGKAPESQSTQPEMDIILERSSVHNS